MVANKQPTNECIECYCPNCGSDLIASPQKADTDRNPTATVECQECSFTVNFIEREKSSEMEWTVRKPWTKTADRIADGVSESPVEQLELHCPDCGADSISIDLPEDTANYDPRSPTIEYPPEEYVEHTTCSGCDSIVVVRRIDGDVLGVVEYTIPLRT